MKRIFLILTFILSWSICLADMPHVLKNGDIVDADQLNENFNYVENRQNQAYTVRSNGNIIGELSNASGDANTSAFIFNPDFEPVTILKSGEIKAQVRVEFINPDCTGDPYFLFTGYPVPEDDFLLPLAKGSIYKDPFSGTLYYYPPKVQTMYAKIPLSYYYNNNDFCYTYQVWPANYYYKNNETGEVVKYSYDPDAGWTQMTQEEIDIYLSKIMIKFLPNDPAITGLPNEPFPTPITFDGVNEVVIIQE